MKKINTVGVSCSSVSASETWNGYHSWHLAGILSPKLTGSPSELDDKQLLSLLLFSKICMTLLNPTKRLTFDIHTSHANIGGG